MFIKNHTIKLVFIFSFSFIASLKMSYANDLSLYSINTGSFTYHVYDPQYSGTQYFDNWYFSIEKRINKSSEYSLFAGTFINSQNNRCALLGVRKDWSRITNRLVFKGVYAYAGEFFLPVFEDCGDGGIYSDIKKSTGIGFAPYIYHALQYNFTDYFGVEGGIILPGIAVLSLQWTF